MTAVEKVIALAEAQVGYHEKAGNAGLDDKSANSGAANYTKYARDLDAVSGFYNGPKQGYAWCDVFVDWLFVQCFGEEKAREMLYQPKLSAGAGCTYSAAYFRSNGALNLRGKGDPQPGDQIFFGSANLSNHTGIVVAVKDGRVYTIEGNSGDQVAKWNYLLTNSSIYGYGRPKWSAVENTESSEAVEPGTVSNSASAGTENNKASTTSVAASASNSAAGTGAAQNSKAQTTANVKTQATQNTGDPVPKAACVTVSLPELESGDIGREVRTLQALLKGYGYNPGEVDGEFGPKTKQAVAAFQSSHGLECDGICGKNTWKNLITG